MDRNELPLDPRLLRVPLGASKIISMPMVHSAQTVHLSCDEINTLQTDWNDLPLDLRHLGAPFGVPKSDFRAYGTFGANHEPILPRDEYDLQIDRNKLPLDQHHLEAPLSVPEKISKPMVLSAQTAHLSCARLTLTQMSRNELPLDQCHLEVPLGMPKKFSMPVIHLTQTIHLSCA
jgi:hypothetical protein